MPTVRRVPEADHDSYRRLIEYAFHPEDGPGLDDDPPDRIADRYGCYDARGGLIGTGALYELDARLRGEWTTVGGIAAVSVPPEKRGSGTAEHLLGEMLTICADRGIGLVTLWPFDHAFYRQFGWAIANRYTVYELPPEQLAAAGTTARGTYERVGPDDWKRLETVQRAHGEGTTLSLRRDEAWWRRRTFDDDVSPWAYAWLVDGDVRGYVLYTFESGEGDGRLRVREFSASDRTARRHLFGLLGTHDSQVETVELRMAQEADLLDAVASPTGVECSVRAGPMVRVSDLAVAVDQCPYPGGASGRVVLDVTDPLGLDQGRFELVVEDGVGTCEPTSADPDAKLDVGTLSQLLVGYRGVEAARGRDLECNGATAATLAELMPAETVCLREFF